NDENKVFLEKPAGKIFEHYMLKEDADESDYMKAERYSEFTTIEPELLNYLYWVYKASFGFVTIREL
ncbi:MAG: hypothetical protein ACFFBU_10255, partial [Promethearchaeota archaeon]